MATSPDARRLYVLLDDRLVAYDLGGGGRIWAVATRAGADHVVVTALMSS